VTAQTRARDRLHAHLVVLLPGYRLTASRLVAERRLREVEAALATLSGVRAELARDLVAEVRELGRQAAALRARIETLVAGHPLLGLPGIGPLVAARLIAETGDVGRFRSPHAFAMLAGVAAIPASSGETRRMRLDRGGDRRPDRALYTIALSQAWSHPPARAYVDRKRSEGMSWTEAIRCLKHRISRPVFRLLQAGQEGWSGA